MSTEHPSNEDPTLTSPSAAGEQDRVDIAKADEVAERVLSEVEPLPFQQRFSLGGQIGRGGMAEVLFGRDRVLNRVVAVKFLHGNLRDQVRFHRFLREAQITAQLAHPNVVPVHAMENTGRGAPAFVMKRVQGESFKEFLARCREVAGTAEFHREEHGRAARLEHFVKICDAVAYAHSRAVIHRDLKPANVMVGAYGEVYVMDWGIASLRGEAKHGLEDSSGEAPVTDTTGLVTGTGGFAGTPMYMAPEQADVEKEIGPAADQFALGMMLYEILELRYPRQAGEGVDLFRTARAGTRLPFTREARVPPALRAIVKRATQVAAAERYASVDALVADVRCYLRNEELEVYPDNLVRKAWRYMQNYPVRVMAGVLLVVVLAAVSSTVSLQSMLAAQDAAARRSEVITGLVAQVSDFVQDKNQRAAALELLVESLGVQVENALRTAPSEGARFPRPADVAAAPDAAIEERYRQVVTFRTPVAVNEGVEEARLAGMTEVFQSLLLRALPEDVAVPEDADLAVRAALLREHARLQYAYAGFESGLLLNFPGNARYPADYDPRQRSWYQRALGEPSVYWGAPYGDASGSGYLLPCNRAVRDAQGRVVGAVGVDGLLGEILTSLQVPDLECKQTWLADAQGRLVADAGEFESGARFATGADEKERRALGVPRLELKLRADVPNGAVQEGEELYVFSRMRSLGWYLVVVLDAAEVLDG